MSGRTTRPSDAAPLATTSQVVSIEGMTCRACERRIEREVGRIPDVRRASASAVRGRVEIVSAGPIPASAVQAAIEAAGYRIGRTSWLSRDTQVWLAAALGIGLVVSLGVIATMTGVTDFAPPVEDIRQGGLVVALLLGLAAGVSTCLALTGGLVLALSAAFAAGQGADAPDGPLSRLRPSVVFVTGRILGFLFLGSLLGALGASIALPTGAVAVLMVAVAVLMTLLGVRLTGLSPRVAAWSPTLPMGLGRRLGMHDGAVTTYSDTRAAALGVATFFLPCGFTQAVQVYALSTGMPLAAGAIMAVFAIGTAPGLLALSGLPTLIPTSARPWFSRVVGIVVLAFALLNGAAGLRLVGISPTIAFAGGPAVTPVVTMENGVQIVRTIQHATGYSPAEAALYAGVPTRWIVESQEGGSCAIFMRVPSMDLAITLRRGDNAIDLPPLKAGRIAYSCSMGMYGGSLTVVDAPDGVLEELAGT